MRFGHRRPATVLPLIAILAAACALSPSPSWVTGAPMQPATPDPSSAQATPDPTPVEPAETTFSLLNFNVEYGGDEVDFDKIVEAIRLADPDVVALEEAEGNTAAIADALGWPYHSVRSQLVSQFPLIDPPGADGMYEFVELRPGEVVAVVNVHLPSDPYGPYLLRDGEPVEAVLDVEREARLAALRPRLDAVNEVVAAGIPVFVAGDFNAPSHLDWTAAMVGVLPQVTGPVAWPVSVWMADAGYRDAYREVHPDPVAAPGLTWWADRPIVDGSPDHADPQDRIDQIYAAGRAIATDALLVGEAGRADVAISTDPWGSDHRAVLAVFRVTPGVPPVFVSVDSHRVTSGDAAIVRYRTSGVGGERIVVRSAVDLSGTPVGDVALDADATDGSVSIDTGSWVQGDHVVELVQATGGVAASTPLHVAAPGAVPSVTLAVSEVVSGGPIKVSFAGAPGARWDWFGLYPRGGDPNVDDYLFYTYTGSRVSGTVTIDASGEGDWPFAPGEYDVLLLSDDGYVELARVPLTVLP